MKNEYGQYFTPRHIADLMVNQISAEKNALVLEPSAGEGVFLDALYEAGFSNYAGIEIDPRLKQSSRHAVSNTSFVSWKSDEKLKVIIGNPPYIRWKHLDARLQDELKKHHLWGSLFNPLSDYLSVFIANAIELLDNDGELIFITPSFWMHTLHTSPLREWMLSIGGITEIIDFGESQVFEKVSSAIVIFKFVKGASPSEVRYWKYIGGRKVGTAVSLENRNEFESYKIPAFKPKKHWTLADEETQKTIGKLESAASRLESGVLLPESSIVRLGDFVDIANGMVSGLDKAFKFDATKGCELTKNELAALMQVAKAKDLGHLREKSRSTYIDIQPGLEQAEVEKNYPNFWKQLMSFDAQLAKRYSYGRELPIWEWAFRRSEKFLTSPVPKIFVPCKERMTNRRTARFALLPGCVVATQDVTAMAPKESTKESIEYILGYLSTVQVSEWIRIRGLMKGGIAEFSEKPLKEIPFRSIDWNNAREVQFHDRVTEFVRNGVKGTKAPEVLIDQLSKWFWELE